MRTSLGTRYQAWLRVYEPLDAFPEPQRSVWRDYVDSGYADAAVLVEQEQVEAVARAAALPPKPVPTDESQDAFVLEIGGIPLVCPRDVRLRSWMALRGLRLGLPDVLVNGFWPGADLDAIEDGYTDWRRRHGERAPHLVGSAWHVPLRWFCAFSPADRDLVLGSEDGGASSDAAGRRLVYRAPMVDARRRVARVLKTLRTSFEEGSVIDDVVALGRWLEEFHPLAWVELDYGGLVYLLDDEALAADTSAADVADAVAALDRGDAEASGEAYARLVERWVELQRREHLS